MVTKQYLLIFLFLVPSYYWANGHIYFVSLELIDGSCCLPTSRIITSPDSGHKSPAIMFYSTSHRRAGSLHSKVTPRHLGLGFRLKSHILHNLNVKSMTILVSFKIGSSIIHYRERSPTPNYYISTIFICCLFFSQPLSPESLFLFHLLKHRPEKLSGTLTQFV